MTSVDFFPVFVLDANPLYEVKCLLVVFSLHIKSFQGLTDFHGEQPMHVLLVDDDVRWLNVLMRVLTMANHTVTSAQSGKEGWEVFLSHPDQFDVVVTDVEMPDLNGLELLERLRNKAYDLPVVIMTGHQDIKFSIQGLRLGASDFLMKPFKFEELLDVLTKLESLQMNKKRTLEDIARFSDDITLVIASQTRLIATVVTLLQDRLKLFCEMHKINVRNIGLCLHEALANAIIHGNLEIASALKNDMPEMFEQLLQEREQLPEFRDRQVHIHCQITPQQFTFEITDQGKGFNVQAAQNPDPLQLHPTGRGLLIITAMMDQVTWNDRGNHITMLKYLQPREVPPPSQFPMI